MDRYIYIEYEDKVEILDLSLKGDLLATFPIAHLQKAIDYVVFLNCEEFVKHEK